MFCKDDIIADPVRLKIVLDNNLLDKTEVDDFADSVKKIGDSEMTAMIMNYFNNNFDTSVDGYMDRMDSKIMQEEKKERQKNYYDRKKEELAVIRKNKDADIKYVWTIKKNKSNNTCKLSNYVGNAEKIFIPSIYEGCYVTEISKTDKDLGYDSIIEIGAIKVMDGEIIEKQEFIFQEFVKPYRSMLTEEVEILTGITQLDLMPARQMWEVFPDFMDFVGDNILLGYNCNRFDSKFMTRAGRYSHIEIKNPYFDVMIYAEQFRKQLGITSKGISLQLLCDKLGVTNPEAHRALADAITTARVFLELRKLDD